MKKLLLLLLIPLLFSCGKKESEDIIKTAIIVDIDSLNPYKFVSATSDEVMQNVYEGLVKPAPNGEVKEAIAKSYSISEDGLTYIFDIRQDVYFHNGTKLEMSDVEFSINKMKELKLQKNFLNIKEVKTDGNKLILTLEKPDASLIYYLTTAIVDKETYDTLTEKANGTGPYMVSEYKREQRLVFEKFDKYYGEKANIPKIVMDISPNFEASFLKFVSHEYNFLSGINSKRIKEVKDSTIETKPRNMLFILGINNDKYPLEIRKALNKAIDKDLVISKVMDSYATKIGKDTDGDLSLLKGKEFTLKVPVNDTIYTDAAQVIKEELSKYGAKVSVNAIEWSSWLQEVYSDKNFSLTLIGFVGKLDKDATYRRYVSNYKRNFSSFKNDKFDELITLAKTTTDAKKRNEIYSLAENILYDNVASVFIMDPNLIVVMDKNVTGYVKYTIPFIDFAKLKIKD